MTAPTGYVPLFPPTQANLIIMVGSRFRGLIAVACDWEADLTSWTGSMQVRTDRSAKGELLADLSAYISVTGLPNNRVLVDIDANAAELIAADWTEGVYDIEITPDPADATRTLRVLQGALTLDTEVTR